LLASLKQGAEIDYLNDVAETTVLKGVELNILKDGSLDIANRVLKRFDFVSAGVHSHFNLERDEMTTRVLNALEPLLISTCCATQRRARS